MKVISCLFPIPQEEIPTWMYRIDRMRKEGLGYIQLILCILYIHVTNSDFGSGDAGYGDTFFKGDVKGLYHE